VTTQPGHDRWLSVRGRNVRGGSGHRLVAGVVVDITREKQREMQATEALRLLQLASETGRIGIAERNLETGAAYWNTTLFDLLGLPHDRQPPSREELLALTHADDVATAQQAWQQDVDSTEVVEFELRQMRSDGQLRRMRTRAWAERRADGTPWRVLGAIVDVTESHEAAARLAAALQRLKLATEAGGVGVWERDLRTGGGTWDRTLFAMMDFPPPEPPSREATLARVHPDDRPAAQAWWQKLLTAEGAHELEATFYRSDGTPVGSSRAAWSSATPTVSRCAPSAPASTSPTCAAPSRNAPSSSTACSWPRRSCAWACGSAAARMTVKCGTHACAASMASANPAGRRRRPTG
jgi:PAS domain-containing protein